MDHKSFIQLFEKEEVVEFPNQVEDRPLVSVCIQTYQHVNFISDCLEGVLKQKTNFKYEIIIGEDESSDGTLDICKSYAQNYPELIRLFLHKRANNIIINGNPSGRFIYLNNLYLARGKYIALCEGDDYWTDPYKLQKQVDFLEANPDYQACAHEVEVLTNNGLISSKKAKSTFVLEDFFHASNLNTCSFIFRNNISFEERHLKAIVGDMVLFILCAQKGKIHFISEPMAVYRFMGQGAYSGVEDKQNHLIKIFESLIIAFPEYKENFESTIHSWLNAPKEFRKDLGWNELEEWQKAPLKNQNKPEEFNGYEKWKEVYFLLHYLQAKYPHQLKVVYYDDLLADASNVVHDIFQFCDLSFNGNTIEFIEKSRKHDNRDAYSVYRNKSQDNHWETQLDQKIITAIEEDLNNNYMLF